jgi:PAS domain S-box-containing protein
LIEVTMNPLRILVVEDEAIVAMDIESRLSRMGYVSVGRTPSGEEAIDLAERLHPDLVFMDIHLAGKVDGIDAAEEIRRKSRIPVVFLSAYSEDATLERAKRAEPFGYIMKPFQDRELKAVIEIAVYRHRAEEEIRRLTRLYDVLSQVNQATVRATSMDELFPAVCKILTERGEFGLAWIGWIDDEESYLVPVATAGDTRLLEKGDFCVIREPGEPSGPGYVYRQETPLICNECPSEECLYPPELAPHTMGFMSCGSFPLRLQKKVTGTLTVCAPTPGYFREQEVTLIQEVALNISYALDKLSDNIERQKSEESLRVNEERYRALVEMSSDWIWELDEQGRYTFASPRVTEILGYQPSELIGRVPFDLMDKDEAKKAREYYEPIVLQRQPITSAVHVLLHRDGHPVAIETNGVPFRDRQGTFQGYRGMDRDITARKLSEERNASLQEQLQQAQKMEAIGTLAGGIAHDFNNILTVVLGYGELASFDLAEGSQPKQNLDLSMAAAHRAKELVQQILSFSRQAKQERRHLDIRPIVKESLKFLRASLPSTIAIEQEIQDNLKSIEADPTQIHQVLINLCTNAAHAMEPHGGVLKVSIDTVDIDAESAKPEETMSEGSYVRLSISDTGQGIPKEILQAIFEPYFTTKDVGKGTGLGLSVVHGIMKSYGGTVTVHSEPGKGSLFEAYFPASEKTSDSSLTEDHVAVPISRGEKILFIDDEKAIVDMARTALTKLGYQVTALADSLDAVELFQSDPDQFDLVITDMTMPHMTGDTVASELLRIRPDIPIILCTGFSEQMTEEKAMAIGVRKYVIKPLIIPQLAETMRKVLDTREPPGQSEDPA